MRKEEFAEVFGDINESYVKEAETAKKAKKSVRLKWCAVAACLCLVAAGVLSMAAGDSLDTGTGGILPGGTTIGTENLGDRDGESCKEAITVSPDEISERDTEFEDAPGMIIDANVPDMDGLDTFDAIWGGIYLDENSCWVVWLTENTPERQAEVFKRNPSLPEDSTTFRTADFSLAYLTELLEKISEGMRDGKLPFVTSAAVMEQINRVSITMTTADESTAAAISSFDPLGGAVEFRVAAGNIKSSLAAAE